MAARPGLSRRICHRKTGQDGASAGEGCQSNHLGPLRRTTIITTSREASAPSSAVETQQYSLAHRAAIAVELTDKCCHLSSTEPPCGRSESCTPAGPGPSASARVGHDGQALFGAGRSRLQQGLKLGLVDAAFPLQLDGGPLGRIPASHGLHWRLPGSGGPDQTSGDSIARSPHPDDMKCRDSWHTPGAGQRSTRRHPRRPAARAPPTRRPPGRGWRPLVRRAETTTPSTAAVEDGGRRGSSSGWRSRCAIT